jgi:hypothetical protein
MTRAGAVLALAVLTGAACAPAARPIEVAGADAGGVRHPALAIDSAGDALLAENSATNEGHPRSGRLRLSSPRR